MPRNVTNETATWTTNVRYPADGDPANEATFGLTAADLANRTQYLRAITDVLTSTGAKRIDSATDIAALRAKTGMSTGDDCLVGTYGLYSYDAASNLAADNVLVVQPTTGGGRWLNALATLRGLALGLAGLDSSGRLPQGQLPQALVSNQTAQILGGGDLQLRAASSSSDSGDLIFADASGSELGRIYRAYGPGAGFLWGTYYPVTAGGVLDTANQRTGQVVLVQVGSNANGNYARYADGTQVCWGTVQLAGTFTNVLTVSDVTYPAAFVANPSYQARMSETGTAPGLGSAIFTTYESAAKSAAQGTTRWQHNFPTNPITAFVSFVAVGRWY